MTHCSVFSLNGGTPCILITTRGNLPSDFSPLPRNSLISPKSQLGLRPIFPPPATPRPTASYYLFPSMPVILVCIFPYVFQQDLFPWQPCLIFMLSSWTLLYSATSFHCLIKKNDLFFRKMS